jgi:hypothetical protein
MNKNSMPRDREALACLHPITGGSTSHHRGQYIPSQGAVHPITGGSTSYHRRQYIPSQRAVLLPTIAQCKQESNSTFSSLLSDWHLEMQVHGTLAMA